MNEHSQISSSYDLLADEYAAHIYHELDYKPLDREWLTRFALTVGNPGPICDLGCGPGHVARYLHEQGAQVLGMDLSPRMIELARQLNPGIEFRVGNMVALEIADESWNGIAAFYSIVHIPQTQIPVVLREFWRVLRPSGEVLLAFHVGDEIRHITSMWEQPVSLDFIFYQRAWVEEQLRAAGFEIMESIERAPYDGYEVETQRAYIHASKIDRSSAPTL